jgi:hypothetical protein
MSLAIPGGTAPGTYTVYVVLDELRSANQSAAGSTLAADTFSASLTIGVTPQYSDLVVQGSLSLSPNPVTAGNSTTLSYTLKNQGAGNAAASTTRVQIKNASGTKIFDDTYPTAALSAGATTPQSMSLAIPGGTAPGTYTVYVVLDELRSANQSAAGSTLAADTFSTSLTIGQVNGSNDTTPPEARFYVSDVSATAESYTFSVRYDDDVAVDVSDFGDRNILVKGPNGFQQFATLVVVSHDSDGPRRTATYQIIPPGGSWDVADNGTYTVSLRESKVSDTSGNYAAPATTTFNVQVAITAPEIDPGNALSKARNIGNLATQTFNDSVGGTDNNDYYRFTLTKRRNFELELTGLSADADVKLLDSEGAVIASSTRGKSRSEAIECMLTAGTYFVRVYPYGGASTNYSLAIAATAPDRVEMLVQTVDWASDWAKIIDKGSDARVEYLIGQASRLYIDSPAWRRLSAQVERLERIGKGARVANFALDVVRVAIDAVNMSTAASADEYADAVNTFVRGRVTWAAGMAGAKAGAIAGVYVGVWFGAGAAVASPLGALFVGLASAKTAGEYYDKTIADSVKEWARSWYNQGAANSTLQSQRTTASRASLFSTVPVATTARAKPAAQRSTVGLFATRRTALANLLSGPEGELQ